MRRTPKGWDESVPESMETSKKPLLIEKRFLIKNQLGFHARPAAFFVRKAQQFCSDILVEMDGKRANGKSITDIIALAITQGSHITIKAKGMDAHKALEDLGKLVKGRFGEK